MTSANEVESESIRDRILDAAESCVLELGYDARLHARIAERSGFSRPTVYKYVGDQAAIVEALFQREVNKFFVVLDAVLRDEHSNLEIRFVDAIVFTVQYARNHEVLQKGLRDHPELVLPWFTVRSGPIVALTSGLMTPHFERLFTPDELSTVDPKAISEWAFRIISSLIVTQGVIETPDEDSLRDFVRSLLRIAFMAPPHT
ncbi:TetR family transcriptional regulator [Antrihabitans stalactiti]|uniref:TetR/AcrR family transcriptional regulator n=1 Tax=Antrihabitans stalactiti TaxID=2584121 RepID=A0A848K7P7_9NOCA|nr:TetR/AcrR family transcriptional regulator [Antrihabitans stalactiti]